MTWGAASKTFTKEELEKGVNLAAEFAENPFGEPFRKVESMIGAKQALDSLGDSDKPSQITRTVPPDSDPSRFLEGRRPLFV